MTPPPQLPEDGTAEHQKVDFLARTTEGPGTEGPKSTSGTLPWGHKVLSSGGPHPRATLPSFSALPVSAETLA